MKMKSNYNKEKMKLVGKNYKKARINNGYTQEHIAETLNLSTSFVSDLERGKTLGSIHTLLKTCNYYKISPNFIISPLLNFDFDNYEELVGYNNLTEDNKYVVNNLIKILNEKQNMK